MAAAAGFTPESPIWRISRESALMLAGGRALPAARRGERLEPAP